ncbi:MAG: hypothetical protein ACLPYS_05805 [Vulcanimicrobiaceae bacterium]
MGDLQRYAEALEGWPTPCAGRLHVGKSLLGAGIRWDLAPGARLVPHGERRDPRTERAAGRPKLASNATRRFRLNAPSGTTPKPVEISEDGSAAAFELCAGTDWEATNDAPIGRVIVRR